MEDRERRLMMTLEALCRECDIPLTSRQRRKYNLKRGTAYHYQQTGYTKPAIADCAGSRRLQAEGWSRA